MVAKVQNALDFEVGAAEDLLTRKVEKRGDYFLIQRKFQRVVAVAVAETALLSSYTIPLVLFICSRMLKSHRLTAASGRRIMLPHYLHTGKALYDTCN